VSTSGNPTAVPREAATTLRVRGLDAGYGRMQVVHGVDLDVEPGEMVCIVGRNGAGKSTAVNAIAGVRHGRFHGSVHLGETDLSSASVQEAVRAGVSLVPEGHRNFGEMNVFENLRMGAYGYRRDAASIKTQLALVYELFPVLEEFRRRTAGSLSGGQQQMVAIGQAIMSQPRLLILDEPSSSLALAVVDDIYSAIRRLTEQGLGLLVVEQNVRRALRRSDRCYVLEAGRMALSGPSAELATDERVNDIVTGVASVRAVDAAC
jgi:branched-chain amino acid transport system ATP-binding protein